VNWTLITKLLGGRSPVVVFAVGLALAGLVGALDYFAGIELSLSIFFLMPVGLVAWYAPRWAGFSLCGISALIWLAADFAAGMPYSQWHMSMVNAALRFGFFLAVACLLDLLRTRLRQEEILARTDSLTQVLNGRAFTELSERLLRLAERHQHPVALAYIDIDNFKAVNDTHGHSSGDRVLQTVANLISGCVRSTDIVGRMGGDEFAVLMPETGQAGAKTAFSKIQEELERAATDHNWPIGFSIGVALFPNSPPSLDEALKIADSLMYRVKQTGKNDVLCQEQAVAAGYTAQDFLPENPPLR
jgi:diguanylate cyclase (GGDEF)-like protein